MSFKGVKPAISGQTSVEVWFCDVDLLSDAVLSELFLLLSPGEQQRNELFLVERPRRLHAAAYALARQAIASRLGQPPDRLRFGRTPAGKPYLIDPAGSLTFNIAHSGSLAVCALTERWAIGVDVEPIDRQELTPGLLHDLLAPAERARLAPLDGTALQEALVALWTGKEAVGKAHGGGLSLPLDRLVVPEGDGAVAMEAIADAAPSCWRLHRLRPDQRHRIALALAMAPDVPLKIDCRDATGLLRDRLLRPPAARSA